MAEHLDQIVACLFAQSWQITLLTILVALLSWLLRHRSAHIRYLLWLIVLAKCLVPPVLEVPVAVLPPPEPQMTPEAFPMPSHEVVVAVTSPPRGEPPVASAPPAPSALTALSTGQWLTMIWLAGVAIFAGVALVKATRTARWLRRQRRALPDDFRTAVNALLSSLAVRRLPRIWLVEGIGQPFVWGLVRGEIYLPTHFVHLEDRHRQRGILGHELSHILRFDAAINTLQIVAQAIFWFHPFVWWANLRIRQEREKCCDEMAIARFGASVKSYSTAIIDTVVRAQESARPVPSLAVAGSAKHIEERIRTMMTPGRKFYKHPSLPVAAVVALTTLLAVPTTVVLTVRAEDQVTTESMTSDSPFNLGPTVNSPDYEWDPCISADGLSLYFLSRRPGGLGDADIWVTTRETRDDPWGTPVNLGSPINSTAFEGAPCISADGLQLHFTSDRPGGCGGYDLWVSERPTVENAWPAPVNLGPPVNSPLSENGPSVSADGLSLYFSEHIAAGARSGGPGGADIWVATRKSKNEPWGTPVNLGPTVNSPDADTSPSISVDGLSLFFMSDRPGFGKTDIWVTTRKSQDDPWGPPVNLGPPINTGYGEWNPDISGDGSTLYFASGRDGSARTDIWQATLTANSGITTDSRARAPSTNLLHKAVKADDLELVRRLIAEGTEVNIRNRDGQTALHYAASSGNVEVTEALLAKGADPKATGTDGRTPADVAMDQDQWKVAQVLLLKENRVSLHTAAYLKDLQAVTNLVQSDTDVNAEDANGKTALHYAAKRGHRNIIRYLVANGSDANAKDRNGNTPLHCALQESGQYDEDITACLLAHGAHVNEENARGETPVHLAVRLCGSHEVVRLLMEQGADASSIYLAAYRGDLVRVKQLLETGADAGGSDWTGFTPLHAAANSGQTEVAELLIRKGADVNAHDKSHRTPTPLFYAAMKGQRDMVELLLARGAKVNAGENAYWFTPLDGAILNRHRDVVELLIAKGANVNALGDDDVTPLHYAVATGDSEVAKLLIRNGADVDMKLARGQTPLHYAVHYALVYGRTDVCNLLLDEGADVDARNAHGETPLHDAASRGATEIAKLLIAAGADVNAKDQSRQTPLRIATEKGHAEIAKLLRKRDAKE